MTDTISTQDFQLLSAYLDGELDGVQKSSLETRLAKETRLAETLSALQAQQVGLHRALAGTAEADSIPARVRALLEAENNVVAFTPRRGTGWHNRTLPRLAVAASLVAAIGLLALPRWQNTQDFQTRFSSAMDSLPSRASGWYSLDDGSRLRPLLSFPHQNGQWCREYLLADEQQYRHGVACRDTNTQHWQAAFSVAYQPTDESSAYRPASAHDQDKIAKWIDTNAADIALGAAAETTLIENQWRQ